MVRVKKIKILAMIVIFTLGCKHFNAEVKVMKITKEQAIKIANKEAKRIGYDISRTKIEIDKNNTVWNGWSGSIHTNIKGETLTALDANPEIKTKLKNKNFWAIYYHPEEHNVFGGDFFIFVDRNSGEIIYSLKFK